MAIRDRGLLAAASEWGTMLHSAPAETSTRQMHDLNGRIMPPESPRLSVNG
jgi:hypothetical protein